jgi:hypothetical protein
MMSSNSISFVEGSATYHVDILSDALNEVDAWEWIEVSRQKGKQSTGL